METPMSDENQGSDPEDLNTTDEDQHDPSSEGVAADADDAGEPEASSEDTTDQKEAKPKEIPRGS